MSNQQLFNLFNEGRFNDVIKLAKSRILPLFLIRRHHVLSVLLLKLGNYRDAVDTLLL